jgi:hypothetical protein
MAKTYLCGISHVLSLLKLDIWVSSLPEVSNSEGAISSLEHARNILLAVQIRLPLVSINSKTILGESIRHTETSSQPWSASALALGLEGSRVTARILNCAAALESPRMDLMTEPPWTPVAPKTTMIFFPSETIFKCAVSFGGLDLCE